jgi:hypothetical protein
LGSFTAFRMTAGLGRVGYRQIQGSFTAFRMTAGLGFFTAFRVTAGLGFFTGFRVTAGLAGRLCSAGEGAEGVLEDVAEEAGALEFHVVAGEPRGDVAESLPDVFGRVEAFDEEGLVLDDGRDGVVAMAIAHVVVVHGVGPAAGAVLIRKVHALVWPGWLALEVLVGVVHVVPPPRGVVWL